MFKFNGFTEKANLAINYAIESAESFGHTYIGSEHLLAGLLKEGSGTAFALLNSKGVTLEDVNRLMETKVGRGEPTSLSPNDLTPRAKHILEMGKQRSQKGFFYPMNIDADKCTSCAVCALMCPEGAIEVTLAKGSN